MLDIIWIVIAAALVLLMQAGFTCLESGLVRSKNSINVAVKNLMDLCVAGSIFWLFGFGLMFGQSAYGWVGSDMFLFNTTDKPLLIAFFLFQLMFCGTAATIISGAVAERMSYLGYMCVTLVIVGCIYPVTGHWAWAGIFTQEPTGWLEKLGFIDFAGSTMVHSVGGWCALAAIMIIGPRIGRFELGQHTIQGSNLPLSVLGTILLWFGWFGFNGGSTLSANELIPLIHLNTCLSAVFGGLIAATISLARNRVVNVVVCINGILGGLVAVTASCHIVTPLSAVVIGGVAGVITYYSAIFLETMKLDDAIGVIPVHLFAGIWGTLAVPVFAPPVHFGAGLNFWQQLGVQMLGVIAIGAYAFSISFVVLKIINKYYTLRVSSKEEVDGLNFSEHQASTEIYDLMTAMQTQEMHGDFSSPVAVDALTDTGQIARQYNHVLERVNKEIANRDYALHAYHHSESRKAAILQSALESVITIDCDGLVLEFNAASEKCFGLAAKQILHKNFLNYFVPDNLRLKFKVSLENQFSIDNDLILNKYNKVILQRLHGYQFFAEISITPVKLGKDIKEYTLHIRDLTKAVKAQAEMKRLANRDNLTGLYNRNYFKSLLENELAQAEQQQKNIYLMSLDLDKFKHINDSIGHKAGDTLLRLVAKTLLEIVNNGDIVCRWGGDEFLVLFPGLERNECVFSKAEEIINQLKTPFFVEGKKLYAQTSIGIALSTPHETTAELLVQHADMAMYEAKEKGSNRYCLFNEAMQQKFNDRYYYEHELEYALLKQQFFVLYQPKVCCQSGRVIGTEALLRWNHPEKGLISPALFIPILEKTSKITQVTYWLLEDVCKQLKQWMVMRHEIPVAINLSARDFLDYGFYDKVIEILEKYEIPANLLEFEITETVLAKNTEQCILIMQKLQQKQIRFSIDDFGTGYSSMNYLKQFPLDTLKIDQAFVNECHLNKEDAAICSAIIALGKSLNLKIVAEGVELQKQLEFLQQLDCDYYQGYYFSKPLATSGINEMLTEIEADI